MTPSEIQRALSRFEGEYKYPIVPDSPRFKKIRKIFNSLKDCKLILDVGCANGAILSPLKDSFEIHGLDISEVLVKEALQSGLKAQVADLESRPIPYESDTFDAVLCSEVIEHFVDTDWVLFEINRVLKPGGVFVLTFPNIRTILGLLMMLFLDLPPMFSARYRAPHFRDFTLKVIKIALNKHGFIIQKAIGCSFYFPRIGEHWSGLASLLPSWASTTIVIAQKAGLSDYSTRDIVFDSELSVISRSPCGR